MATTPNDAASREALEKYNSDDTQPATARLKKRKAASAYLARQRHKSFVGGLQNETCALESRVVELRSRKGKLFEACGSAMRERMCAALSEERQRQLLAWLEDSRLGVGAGEDNSSDADSDDGSEGAVIVASSAADAAAVIKAELSAAVGASSSSDPEAAGAMHSFLADAVSAMDSLEDGEELLVYCEEELREAYGDGLFVLLQHLAANRQPCFREYMRLKNDGTAEGEDEERWTNLNALEESFVELNHSHVDHFVGPALPTVA